MKNINVKDIKKHNAEINKSLEKIKIVKVKNKNGCNSCLFLKNKLTSAIDKIKELEREIKEDKNLAGLTLNLEVISKLRAEIMELTISFEHAKEKISKQELLIETLLERAIIVPRTKGFVI